MRIGELSESTGASVRSLRYYEQQGLLNSQRSASGQRHYGADAVDRVRLLRRLYAAGLNSMAIASLMPCVAKPSAAVTEQALAVMHREQARIDSQLEALATTRRQLTYLIDSAEEYHRGQEVAAAVA